MAKSISVDLQAALDDGARNLVALFTFGFAQTYGLWTGAGEIPYNGITYRAGGSLIDIDDIEESMDGSVGQMTLQLSAQPEKGLTDDVLVRLFDEDWHMQNVTVQIARIDPETGAIVDANTFFRGRIEDASFEEGDDSQITANCVSVSIDLSIPGGQYRNSSTQAQIDPNDTALDGVGNLNGTIHKDAKWGQA